MPNDAAITVRIPHGLKRRLEALARRERRSLSAQVTTCLEASVDSQAGVPTSESARLLGMFQGARVPAKSDFEEVRRLLWGSMVTGGPRRRA